ncbi:MAG: hypothetical protein AB8I80_15345 [Anaerolineae bacterium]
MKRLRGFNRLSRWLRPRARDVSRFYRERIDALRHASPSDNAFFDYVFLLGELDDDELIAELRGTFRREWVLQMRRELARYLRTRQFELARRRIADMGWEWQEGVGQGAPAAVAKLIEHLEHPGTPLSVQALDDVLDGFKAIGLEATEPIVAWIAASAGDVERTADVLFSRAGTSGRYLVRQWGQRDRAVQAWLRARELLGTPALPRAGGPCAFWPDERTESPVGQQGVARLALDFNPFGPDKAEQDPLLPDLFYRLWPVWQEVITPRPSILVAPAGSGRSALIWMMRYESELAGSAVERCLAAYVPLHVPLDPVSLARHLARAVYVALTCLVARYPDALLALDEAGQCRMGDFFMEVAGGLPPLLTDLDRAGLRAGEPDTQLVHEALARIVDRNDQGVVPLDGPGSDYSLAAIRALLRDAFTHRELIAFCQDRPALRPVLAEFGPKFSFADMIDTLVDYALRRDQVKGLLAVVSAFNPRQFERHGPFLAGQNGLHTTPARAQQVTWPRAYGSDYIFLLVDVSFEEEAGVAMLLECLLVRWLNWDEGVVGNNPVFLAYFGEEPASWHFSILLAMTAGLLLLSALVLRWREFTAEAETDV